MEFPTRYKLKVKIKGEDEFKIFKSKDYNYLLSKQQEFKDQYKPKEVEFFFVASNVLYTKKPRYKEFSNFPKDWDNVNYGKNSQNVYYLINLDTEKVIRLKEKK